MKPAARFKDDVDTLTFLLDGPVPKKGTCKAGDYGLCSLWYWGRFR